MGKESVQNALIKKAEQIKNATELLLEKTRDWQVIKAYLCNRLNDMELTTEQQKKKDRYQFIYNQMISGKYTDQDIVHQVMKIYHLKIAAAYEDMSSTREIFNAAVNINKRFELNLQLQINRNMLRKAEEMGDMKAYAQIEKNRALLLKQLPDEDENPAEYFEGHFIEAVFDPTLLGAPAVDMKEVLRVINEKRDKKINIDMFEELHAEDVKPNDTDQTSL
jgi:hypothetical protein